MRECLLDHLMRIVEYLISYSGLPMTGVYVCSILSIIIGSLYFCLYQETKSYLIADTLVIVFTELFYYNIH